jgi:hypothetical protein
LPFRDVLVVRPPSSKAPPGFIMHCNNATIAECERRGLFG